MFERFTDRARRVVVLAQEEARLLDHGYIGTEHILLGLIHEGESVGAQALTSMGIALHRVRHEVEDIIGTGVTPGSDAHIPFTPRAKTVLELSLREALKLGHNHIGSEHILLGLVGEGEGVAAQVLVRMGATPERVRARVIALLSGRDVPVEVPAGAGLEPPRCPSCRVGLEDTLRQRPLVVSGDPPVVVTVVWCGVCGTALGLAPPPPA